MTETDVYSQVFAEYLEKAKSPAWRMAFEIALGDWMRDIATYHQGPIQAIADRAVIRQLDQTRDTITKRFLLTRLEEIRKERVFRESDVVRDGKGQFAPEGRRGSGPGPQTPGISRRQPTPDWARRQPSERSQRNSALVEERIRELQSGKGARVIDRERDAMEFLSRPITLDITENEGDHEAELLRRSAAMTYALEEKTLNSKDRQRIQYTITGPKGSRVVVPGIGALPNDIDYAAGERVQYMAPVGPDHPATVAGKVMDIGLVAGLDDERAAKAGSVVADIHDSLNTTSWGQRLNNVANVARVVSNNSPMAVQAHAVAGLVQILGPDAARAFGPKMRQLSYRYSGQEALPSQYSEVARGGKQIDSKGVAETTAAFERRLEVDLARSLPTGTEYKAALQAGTTPPSKGYLLDKNGKVVSEAVGFADDWYTPFNLKRLPKLKHGSYVRTRGYGGLTPEDIQLALHTGAQRVTVVSNSGVFSLELDDRARNHGHRFGFGGTAMQRRYAKSLDAIKNSKVRNPQAPDRSLQLDALGYKTALTDLKNKYPYFVAKVRADGPVNAAARGDGESVPGTPDTGALDEGYVRPLHIKASGAQYGYADTAVLAPGNVRDGEQKYFQNPVAYDQLDRYRLARGGEMLAGAAAVSAAASSARPSGNGNGGNGGGGAVANAGARNDTPVAGGAMQDPAYNDPKHKIESKDATRVLDNLSAMFAAHPNMDVGDMDGIQEALANATKGDKDWTALRDKVRDDKKFRDALLDAMEEVFGGTKEGKELLPGLANLAIADAYEEEEVEVDAEDPNFTAGGFYHAESLLPMDVIAQSPAMKAWTGALNGREDVKGNKERAELTWFLQEMGKNQKSWDAFNKLDDDDKTRFEAMHSRVVRALNDDIDLEIARRQDPQAEQKPDTPAARQADAAEQAIRAPQDLFSFDPAEALASPMPKNYVADKLGDIMATAADNEDAAKKIHQFRLAVEGTATRRSGEEQRKLREMGALIEEMTRDFQ